MLPGMFDNYIIKILFQTFCDTFEVEVFSNIKVIDKSMPMYWVHCTLLSSTRLSIIFRLWEEEDVATLAAMLEVDPSPVQRGAILQDYAVTFKDGNTFWSLRASFTMLDLLGTQCAISVASSCSHRACKTSSRCRLQVQGGVVRYWTVRIFHGRQFWNRVKRKGKR